MAGHILLMSCLLAICLPIVFVQLPRFAIVQELHAEIEAETRSTVLRRRSLSPSRAQTRSWTRSWTRQILRWIARSWSPTGLDVTEAESEQKQSSSEKTAQSSGGRRWHTSVYRPIFEGDACADGGYSSTEEDQLRKARVGKKPWDQPFRRQLDGSPLPSSYYLSRSAQSAKTKEPTSSSCRHSGHPRSASSVPQSPSVASVPSDCNACPLIGHCDAPKSSPSYKGRESSMPSKGSGSAPVAPPSESVLVQCPLGATKSAPQEPSRTTDKERMPLWQVLLVAMGFAIFVFAFAVLVAHSLAWFLVYKTEARLGEVRAGLLRGGEMKLCLCGRG